MSERRRDEAARRRQRRARGLAEARTLVRGGRAVTFPNLRRLMDERAFIDDGDEPHARVREARQRGWLR